MNKHLANWVDATDKLATYFVKKYFGKDAEYYWIGSQVGDTIEVADYFFSLDDMVNFLFYSYSQDDMFAYYDYAFKYHVLSENEKREVSLICIRDWKKLKKK